MNSIGKKRKGHIFLRGDLGLILQGEDRADQGKVSLGYWGQMVQDKDRKNHNPNESGVSEGKLAKDKATEVINPTDAEDQHTLPDSQMKCGPKSTEEGQVSNPERGERLPE